ncbi:MAG: hypothetical protein ACTS4W_00770 [Candidatus Hodgkinia cicadicola]
MVGWRKILSETFGGERKLVTLESLTLSNFRATLVYGMNWIIRNIGLRLVLHGSCAER